MKKQPQFLSNTTIHKYSRYHRALKGNINLAVTDVQERKLAAQLSGITHHHHVLASWQQNSTQPKSLHLTSLNYSLIRHQASHSFFVESPPFPWPAFQKPHNVLYVTSFVITHRSGNCIDHTAERSQGRHVVGGGMEVRAGGARRFEAAAEGRLYHQPPPTHSRVLTP